MKRTTKYIKKIERRMIHCLSPGLVLSSCIMKSQSHRVDTDKEKIHTISITWIPQCPQQKNYIIKKKPHHLLPAHPSYESRVVPHPATKVYKKQRHNQKQTLKIFSALLPSPPLSLFKRQIHYDVINWLVFKRREIYSNIVSRYMMGGHTHTVITMHGSFFLFLF
jgi:hypothetical protein